MFYGEKFIDLLWGNNKSPKRQKPFPKGGAANTNVVSDSLLTFLSRNELVEGHKVSKADALLSRTCETMATN